MRSKSTYFCVKCKFPGCDGDIVLVEFSADYRVRFPERPFKVRHADCGVEFTYDPAEVYRAHFYWTVAVVPHPDFTILPG